MNRPGDRSGFALLTVLWLIVALGVLGLHFHASARADRRAVTNGRDATRALWAARGGLEQALDLIDRTLVRPYAAFPVPSGEQVLLPPIPLAANGVTGEARILDVRARLNLNLAEAPELVHLFSAVGIPAGRAAALADAILDWRDPDAVPRPRGAEAARYRTRSPPAAPRNGPFTRIEELREVWGVGADDYLRLAPHLTVHGDGRINVNTATLPVLLTLPGVELESARQFTIRRRGSAYNNVYQLLAELPSDAQRADVRAAALLERVAFTPRTVEIVSSTAVEGSPVQVEVRAVAELAGGDRIVLVQLQER